MGRHPLMGFAYASDTEDRFLIRLDNIGTTVLLLVSLKLGCGKHRVFSIDLLPAAIKSR